MPSCAQCSLLTRARWYDTAVYAIRTHCVSLCVCMSVLFFFYLCLLFLQLIYILSPFVWILLWLFFILLPTFRLNAFACIIIMVMVRARIQTKLQPNAMYALLFHSVSFCSVRVQMCFRCSNQSCAKVAVAKVSNNGSKFAVDLSNESALSRFSSFFFVVASSFRFEYYIGTWFVWSALCFRWKCLNCVW